MLWLFLTNQTKKQAGRFPSLIFFFSMQARAITDALRRTHELMGGGLEQASEARETLTGDGESLRSTFDQHRVINSTVSKASKVGGRILGHWW
jgi:hypothetical protein